MTNFILLIDYAPEAFLTFFVLISLIYFPLLKINAPEDTFSIGMSMFWFSLITLCCTFMLCISAFGTDLLHDNFMLINSPGTQLLKIIVCAFSIIALAPIGIAFNEQNLELFEFYVLYLISVLSTLLLLSCADFLTLYLIIEIQALCFYILASFNRKSSFSAESGIKYFLLGSIMSCILLFGMSLLYGTLGTLNFYDVSSILLGYPFENELKVLNINILISVSLILSVILFKLGIVPFHAWVPDVYENAPLGSTIILSFLPKLVLFDLLIKFTGIFHSVFDELSLLIVFLGLLTVFYGAVGAFSQERLKRFLIYSSISQTGFPLVLLPLIKFDNSASAIYLFLIVYTLSTILGWSGYVYLIQCYPDLDREESISTDKKVIYITDFKNLKNFSLPWAFFFTVLFFSMSGIPPLAGFLIKFSILQELIHHKFFFSAISLVLLSIVPTFYYIRIIKLIFFESDLMPNKEKQPQKIFLNDNKLFYFLCLTTALSLLLLLLSSIFLDFLYLIGDYIYLTKPF
jgi:NADH-quinone oxidoreductase subunit N